MKRRRPMLLCCALSLAAGIAVLCANSSKDHGSNPAPLDLTGQWEGSYGPMAIRQWGDSITGVYEYNCGQISGKVTAGGQVEYRWWENAKGLPYDSASEAFRGDGYFDVRADSDSLVGKWRYEGETELLRDWVVGRFSDTPDSAGVVANCVVDTSDTSSDTTGMGAADTAAPPPGLLRNTDLSDDLLFQFADSGGQALYYCGRETADSVRLTHIIFRDSTGALSAVIMHEYLPVQWILPEMSMAAFRLDDAVPFDPAQAAFVYMSNAVEESLIVDIDPADLDSTIARIERLTGNALPEARQYLTGHSISSFAGLVALADGETGDARLSAMAAAAGFGLANGSGAIGARFAGLGKTRRTLGLEAAFKPAVKAGAAALGGLLGRAFGPGSGSGPMMGVLLCQGAAKYGVCHYMFFPGNQIGECIGFCQTSLGCYTDICMPMSITWEEAEGFNARLFGQ